MKRLAVLLILVLGSCCGVSAQIFTQSYNFSQKGIGGPQTGTNFTNTGVSSFLLAWNPAGALGSCSVQVDSSTDGVTWGSGDVIASQSCTAIGSASGSFTKTYVRINVTAMSGSGGLNVTLTGTIGGSGGGGITQVTSVPGTCTATSAPVQLTVAPFGVYTCNNGIYQLVGSVGSSILATTYGALFDAQTVGDASITNGAAIVTCPNADCNFTAADVGKIAWMTNLKLDTDIITVPSVLVVPQTTILSVQSATQATLNTNATVAGCVANCVLVWGHDDSTALASAWTAAIAACGTVQLPQGYTIVQSAQFNANSAQDKCIIDRTAGYSVLGVQGMGSANTTIIPSPNFSAASCTGTTAADGCFFGSTAIQVQGLAIWGSGIGAIGAGFNGKTAVHLTGTDAITSGSNSYIYNVLLATWGATTAGFTGFKIDGESDALAVGVHNDGMGSTGCNFSVVGQGKIDLFNQFCAVNNVTGALISGGAINGGTVNSFGGVYGFGLGVGQAAIEVNGTLNGCGIALPTGCITFNSDGDAAPYATNTGGGTELWCHANSTCHITNGILTNTTAGGKAIVAGTTAIVTAQNSTISSTGAGASPAIVTGGASATNIFRSLGGNVISSTNGKAVDTATNGGAFQPHPTDIITGTVTDLQAITGTGACATITTISGLAGMAGKLTCTGTTGASTIVLTPTYTAANGWSCAASDLTTAANVLRQSATATTTCTIAGTVNLNDVLTFTATPY